ncbi:MAG TPA: hypothetical protein VHL57_04025 [Flavobacteriales bacterium]|jgi:hypothetical protein|nr:hypothetical protein [Flavobacteriales bacterium]
MFALVAILLPVLGLSVWGSVIWLLLSRREKRAQVLKSIVLLYAIGFVGLIGLFVLLGLFQVWAAPTTVERDDVIGTYRVDKTMFAGEEANWQHDHFRLTITESDTVILESMDLNGQWHTFTRRIRPVLGHRSYLWRFPTEGDDCVHHVLANTPTLHREQFGFYYTFRSPRFGNMFFRKED